MPRDVATRWNSTYAMIQFAVKYKKAIDIICDRGRCGLREQTLSGDEWELAEQLSIVLKVCCFGATCNH
jgi:hypothetical protein